MSEDPAWPRYPHAIGDHVEGPGCGGEVIARPGPYSVTIRNKRDGVALTLSNSQIRGEGDDVPETLRDL